MGDPYFDALNGEHIESKIMRNVLKAWVSLQKKISPFVYVPSCGTLSQEHCFAQVKIKITIEFENWPFSPGFFFLLSPLCCVCLSICLSVLSPVS